MLNKFCQLIFLLAVIVVVQLSGCSRLPEYARPQFSDSAERPSGGPGFGYRPLKVSDFQATALPNSHDQYDHRIQARSCITLRSSGDTSARISRGQIDGSVVYVGRFSQIRFEAEFNPACSWWSPDVRAERVDYVLQHELIHFALTEITARRLNLEKREEILHFMAIGSSPEEVRTQLQKEVKEVSRAAMSEDIAVHTAFDEDTSLYFDPAIQQRWYEKVTSELRELESIRRDRSTPGDHSARAERVDQSIILRVCYVIN